MPTEEEYQQARTVDDDGDEVEENGDEDADEPLPVPTLPVDTVTVGAVIVLGILLLLAYRWTSTSGTTEAVEEEPEEIDLEGDDAGEEISLIEE